MFDALGELVCELSYDASKFISIDESVRQEIRRSLRSQLEGVGSETEFHIHHSAFSNSTGL